MMSKVREFIKQNRSTFRLILGLLLVCNILYNGYIIKDSMQFHSDGELYNPDDYNSDIEYPELGDGNTYTNVQSVYYDLTPMSQIIWSLLEIQCSFFVLVLVRYGKPRYEDE